MNISYGVTTVPERRHTTLPETLDSLADVGFEWPILFVDGSPNAADYSDLELPVVFRETDGLRIQAFGNFVLACWELYVRSPQADLYFIFQDDLKLGFDLDWFLSSETAARTDCWWNFYTTRETFVVRDDRGAVVKTLAAPKGWSQSAQRGQGALAMAFPNRVFRKLLNSPRLTANPLNHNKGHRDIDGAVSDALKAEKILELAHIPSLVYHLGEKSAIGHGARPQADPWWGEDWYKKEAPHEGSDDIMSEERAVHPQVAEVSL